MKRRTMKKNGLQTAIDNAHDIAVMERLLRLIWVSLKNKTQLNMEENPFNSERLNDELFWVWSTIKELSESK